jgi:hypothetical protein
MNQALRRDEIIRTLEGDANGSFWVIQRALSDSSRLAKSSNLDIDAVRKRIKEILAEMEAENDTVSSDE